LLIDLLAFSAGAYGLLHHVLIDFDQMRVVFANFVDVIRLLPLVLDLLPLLQVAVHPNPCSIAGFDVQLR
jgi:hypothetical protein